MSGPMTPDNVSADNTSENATGSKAVEVKEEGSTGEAVSGSGVPEKVARFQPHRNTPKRSSAAFSAPSSSRRLDQAAPTPSTAESSMDSRIPAGIQNSFFLSQEKNKDRLHRSPQENEERLRKLLGLSGTTGSSAANTQEDSDNQEDTNKGVLSQGQRRVHDVDNIAGQEEADEPETGETEAHEPETEGQPEEQDVASVEGEDAEDEAESEDGPGDVTENHEDLEPARELDKQEQQSVIHEVQPVQHPRRDWSNYTTTGSHSRVESFVQGFHSLIGIERRKVIQRLGLITEEDLLETEGLLEEASAELEKYSGYEDLSTEIAEYKELAEDNAAAYDTVQEQLTMLMDHCEEREAYIEQLHEELSGAKEDLAQANGLLESVDSALMVIDSTKYPNIVLGKDYSGLAKIVADAESASDSADNTEGNEAETATDNESEAAENTSDEDNYIQEPDMPETGEEDISQTSEDYSATLESTGESTEE